MLGLPGLPALCPGVTTLLPNTFVRTRSDTTLEARNHHETEHRRDGEPVEHRGCHRAPVSPRARGHSPTYVTSVGFNGVADGVPMICPKSFAPQHAARWPAITHARRPPATSLS